MKNRFMYDELVIANGRGKIYNNKKVKCLGFIKQKDYYFNEYLVKLLSSKKSDWFKEKNIERVMERKFKKMEKYKVVIAIENKGLDIIKKKIENMPDPKNNILLKADYIKEYEVKNKKYTILGWSITYWPLSNYSVESIQRTLDVLREKNIAYQQIIVGNTNPTFIKINEFIDNDENVNILEPVTKIKIKNMGGILI